MALPHEFDVSLVLSNARKLCFCNFSQKISPSRLLSQKSSHASTCQISTCEHELLLTAIKNAENDLAITVSKNKPKRCKQNSICHHLFQHISQLSSFSSKFLLATHLMQSVREGSFKAREIKNDCVWRGGALCDETWCSRMF